MKKAYLGSYILWQGQLAKIIGLAKYPTVDIEILEPNRCPHCSGELPNKRFSVVEESRLFQVNAKPVPTIKTENTDQ